MSLLYSSLEPKKMHENCDGNSEVVSSHTECNGALGTPRTFRQIASARGDSVRERHLARPSCLGPLMSSI